MNLRSIISRISTNVRTLKQWYNLLDQDVLFPNLFKELSETILILKINTINNAIVTVQHATSIMKNQYLNTLEVTKCCF